MAQIRWTRSAKAGLAAIVRSRRERVGFNAARTLHQTITQRAFLLKEFPELGQQMWEVPDDDLRELFVSVYRIIYRIESDTVFIVNIEDARMLFSRDNEENPDPDAYR